MDDAARWNARYRDLVADDRLDGELVLEPPSALRRCASHLPTSGVAIDLAGGNGGGALWLAGRGLHAVLVEASDVAIGQARAAADRMSRTIDALQLDLSDTTLRAVLERVATLPSQTPTDRVTLVSCFHYLQRNLLASVADGLPPGAIFVAAIATTTNRERNDRPSPRFLLEPGELSDLVVGHGSDGNATVEVLHSYEGWNDGNHHEAELVVRRS